MIKRKGILGIGIQNADVLRKGVNEKKQGRQFFDNTLREEVRDSLSRFSFLTFHINQGLEHIIRRGNHLRICVITTLILDHLSEFGSKVDIGSFQ